MKIASFLTTGVLPYKNQTPPAKSRAGTVIELVFPPTQAISQHLQTVVMAKTRNREPNALHRWVSTMINTLDLTQHLHPNLQKKLENGEALCGSAKPIQLSLPSNKSDLTTLYRTRLKETDWAIKFINALVPDTQLTADQLQALDAVLLERNAQAKNAVFMVLPNSANPKSTEAYNPINLITATPAKTKPIMQRHNAIITEPSNEKATSAQNVASFLSHHNLQETILTWLLEQGLVPDVATLDAMRLSTQYTRNQPTNPYSFVLLATNEYQRVERTAEAVASVLEKSRALLPVLSSIR